MSGIKVSKKALAQFEEMKKKRTHKFLIMGIEKEKVKRYRRNVMTFNAYISRAG